MADFQELLYNWYERNKRPLPWRETSDPYKIWVSEIILQQTRVNQGIGYYLDFIRQFPDVASLARADEDEVLKLWQGRGCYSRARNMHLAAQSIVNEWSGIFPSEFTDILKLRGIGVYTAAAIASIAFGKPFPVVDGNVYRVLSRYYCIDESIDSYAGKNRFISVARELIDNNHPGLHNQALMEFGALQCIPQNPDCTGCIFNHSCLAFLNGRVIKLPVKDKKPKQKSRYFNYFLIEKDETLFIQKRTGNDIWKNLFQLPLIETILEPDSLEIFESPGFKALMNQNTFTLKGISRKYRHVLSHQLIFARFYHLMVGHNFILSGENMEILKKDIHKFAVPRLIEIYLSGVDFLNLENQPAGS